METRFTEGSIRRHQKRDGGWAWQLVVTEYRDGKKRQHARLTDIACDPGSSDRSRGTRDAATGKGARQAQAALAEFRKQLIQDEADRERMAAEAAEAEARAEQERKEADSSANAIVADYIADYIDRAEKAHRIEASTAKAYTGSLQYIRQAWPSVTWREVNPAMVRQLEADLTEDGRSSSTVGKVHRLMHLVSRELLNDDALERDPMRGVKPPKRVNKNPNAYSASDMPKVLARLEELPDSPCVTAAYLALCAGLRRGEIAGLRWKDVDFRTNTITVARSIGVGRSGAFVKSPKTDRIRDVPMTATLSERLAKLRASTVEASMRYGLGSSIAELYVAGELDGSFCHPIVLSRQWTELAKVIGIVGTEGRVPTLHDLRHTFATASLAAGTDVKTLASEMGHANAAMTLNIYASADPKAKQAAAKQLDNLMKPKKADVVEFGGTGTDGR